MGFGAAQTGTSNTNDRNIWMDNSGKINFGIYPSPAVVISSTNSYNDGSWHHVVGTFTANSLLLYVDGQNVASQTVGVSNAQNYTGYWRIGYVATLGAWTPTPTSGYFQGSLDEAAVYNSVLTPTQITEHYQTGLNGNYKAYPGNVILADKPVGYWRLGEKSGTVAYDSSGNNINGSYLGNGGTLNQPGVLTNDSDSSVQFNGSTDRMVVPYTVALNPSTFSVEAWAKVTGGNGTYRTVIMSREGSTTPDLHGYNFYAGLNERWQGWVGYGTSFSPIHGDIIQYNTWTHLAMTYNGTTQFFYVNGVLAGSASVALIPNTAAAFDIGDAYTGYRFPGNIDEVAFYNYALSPTQVAAHYNSGNGPGWWTCQSQTQMSNSNWNLLSTIYDGTTAKLFVNGRQECSVTPGTTYSGAVANTVVGSNPGRTNNFWQGLISTVKLFGTSNTTAPATSATIKANFDSEANRYRSTPIENIVTNGLILNLDAANAKQGIAPYSNGCASTDLSWFDLTSGNFNGVLQSFSSCSATTGWNGNGTVANPYTLALNGTSNYVTTNLVIPTTAYTKIAWIKWAGSGPSSQNIISSSLNTGHAFLLASSKLSTGHNSSWTVAQEPTPLTSGTWHQVAVTYNSAVAGGTLLIYRDGNLVAGPVTSVATPAGGNSSLTQIGAFNSSTTLLFRGSIAAIQVYNSALTLQQIKQNCLAQESRFTNTPQSICAAP
jgi:hypothetical protein